MKPILTWEVIKELAENTDKIYKIIQEYKPRRGHYDLSKRPRSLGKKEYARVLNLQNYLASRSQNISQLQKNDPEELKKLLILSAGLRQIVSWYWKENRA